MTPYSIFSLMACKEMTRPSILIFRVVHFLQVRKGTHLVSHLSLEDSASAPTSPRPSSRNHLLEYHYFIAMQHDTMICLAQLMLRDPNTVRDMFPRNPPFLAMLIPFLPRQNKTCSTHSLSCVFCFAREKTPRCFVVVSLSLSLFRIEHLLTPWIKLIKSLSLYGERLHCKSTFDALP